MTPAKNGANPPVPSSRATLIPAARALPWIQLAAGVSAWWRSRTSSMAGRSSSIRSRRSSTGASPRSRWRSRCSSSRRPGSYRSRATWSTASGRGGWWRWEGPWSAPLGVQRVGRDAQRALPRGRRRRHRCGDRLWHERRQRAEVVSPPARLAAGITAAAFGAGSALTVLPISHMIRDRGFEAASSGSDSDKGPWFWWRPSPPRPREEAGDAFAGAGPALPPPMRPGSRWCARPSSGSCTRCSPWSPRGV